MFSWRPYYVIKTSAYLLMDSLLPLLVAYAFAVVDLLPPGVLSPAYGVDYMLVTIHDPVLLGRRFGIWFSFVLMLFINRYRDELRKDVRHVPSL